MSIYCNEGKRHYSCYADKTQILTNTYIQLKLRFYRFQRVLATLVFLLGLIVPVLAAPIELQVTPSLTNPEIKDIGNAKHHVAFDPAATLLNRLVVFLPGTGNEPQSSREFLQTAAALGHHSIGLMYDNRGMVDVQCDGDPDLDCSRKVRMEIIEGIDLTQLENIDRANSIVGRLTSLLKFLNQNSPTQGWGDYLDESNEVRWDMITISGHSQGSGTAAMIAKTRLVKRCIMFSGGDWQGDQPSQWILDEGVTPPIRWFDFTHLMDQKMRLARKWDALELTELGDTIIVEDGSPPFDCSHTLTSLLPSAGTGTNYHGAVVVGNVTPRDSSDIPLYKPVWEYMLTSALTSTDSQELEIKSITPEQIAISWIGTDYTLEASTSLEPESWTAVSIVPSKNGDRYSVVITPPDSRQFFRLTTAAIGQGQ